MRGPGSSIRGPRHERKRKPVKTSTFFSSTMTNIMLKAEIKKMIWARVQLTMSGVSLSFVWTHERTMIARRKDSNIRNMTHNIRFVLDKRW